MSSYSAQLREEQQAVSRAYGRLDDLRTQARARLDTVRAAGSHGSPTQRTERDSFATMYEDRLTQLRAVEDRLVFGRLDDVHGAHRYIGRIGLSNENHEPILTDWRADAARPFYEATPSNHGDIVMRRHITLSFREVVGVEDEVLDVHSDQVGQASSDGTLTGEGALLASLNAKRTGKMTDIVATIQAEQDRIIRADLNQAVVVQGGPGTGKTAVALHRAAYLLYTHRRMLERSGVLVVGPSSTFLHYIDQVLPSLGETGVVSRTIADLIPGVIATAHDNPFAAKLKGERRMSKAIANAVAARERVPASLPSIRINGFAVPIVRADIEQAITDAKRTRQQHNKARETFVHSMLIAMRNRYVDKLDYEPEQAELTDVMQQLRMNDTLRKTLNLAWLPMTGEWLIDQLFCKPQQLRRFAPWLEERDIEALVRPKGSPFTVSDIPLGTLVGRGEQIGSVGTAHGNYLAHLHFEMIESIAHEAGMPGYGKTTFNRINPDEVLKQYAPDPEMMMPDPIIALKQVQMAAGWEKLLENLYKDNSMEALDKILPGSQPASEEKEKR